MNIHCAQGITAVIPEHLLTLHIDAAWLKKQDACSEGTQAFKAKFKKGALYTEVRAWLVEIQRPDWESWIQSEAGGDVATAGDSGTATAGANGVISIQYYDHASSRYKVMIGYIGEGGLKPGLQYRLNEQAQFEVVPAQTEVPAA